TSLNSQRSWSPASGASGPGRFHWSGSPPHERTPVTRPPIVPDVLPVVRPDPSSASALNVLRKGRAPRARPLLQQYCSKLPPAMGEIVNALLGGDVPLSKGVTSVHVTSPISVSGT